MLALASVTTVTLFPPKPVPFTQVTPIEVQFTSGGHSTSNPFSVPIQTPFIQFSEETHPDIAQTEPSSSVNRVFVPFVIENEEAGQVFITIFPDGRIQFPAATVLEAMRPLLQAQPQQQLETAVDSEGFLTIEAFRQVGIEAEFDQRQLLLRFNIPPRLKSSQAINLENLPPEARNAIPVSDLSGWVNMRFQQDLDLFPDSADTNLSSFLANFESVINYQGWILENEFSLQTDGGFGLRHQRTTLIQDDPIAGVRYRLGDFNLPAVGFQSSGRFTGVAVTKNFSILPYQRTIPTETIELFLEEPATVDIYINDRLSQTLDLPEGQQIIRNLSLGTGSNNIQAIITTESGQIRLIDFDAPLDFRLLAPGLQEFSYGLGFPQGAQRRIDFSQLTLAAFHRLGITKTLTLGGYLQGTVEQQLLGIEGVWATSLGSFDFDTACSHGVESRVGCAAEVNYRYFHNPRELDFRKNFIVRFEYQDPNFIRPQQSQPNENFTYRVSANYRQELWANFNLNLGLNYQLGGQDNENNSNNLTLGLSKGIPLGNNLRATAGIVHRFRFNQPDETGVTLNLSWLIPQTRQVVNASVNTLTKTNQVRWSSFGSNAVAPLRSNVVYFNTPNQNFINTDLEYEHPRGHLRLNQNLGLGESFNTLNTINRLRLETAIAFADGYFALTRPITNSFVLVAPHPNLEEYPILLNPSGEIYEARIDEFGAGVIPDLTPYRVSNLLVDAPELPIGYDLGPSSYTLFPSYRSGTLIRVGSGATVFLRGTLVDTECEAIGLQVVEVEAIGNANEETITFFTNRVGRFAAPGFRPGRYELRLVGQPEITRQFIIPEGTDGVYNLETLQVPEATGCESSLELSGQI